MDRYKLVVEYYRPATAGDGNVGGGYATIKSKGLGAETSREETYPYRYHSVGDDEDLIDDIEEFISDYGISDTNLSNRLSNKTGSGYITDDPVGSNRADRASFASNQRLDIASLREIDQMPATRRGDSVHGSMSPIPLKSLYKGFSGPAVGGTSNSLSYRTAPGRKSGTQYGTSRAPLPIEDDEIRIFNAKEIPDPSVRAMIKTRNNIAKALSELDLD
jgi:hypothetical protein